ncbi:MAG: DUF4369 domain-containing protein [Muribaculaceae bacterium]|nr:DUF4369 domain-containing protein [Muribaculaceae bacterium]
MNIKRLGIIAGMALIAGGVATTLDSCKSTPEWGVDGKISDADGKLLTLEASHNGNWYQLDTVTLGSDGAFKFKQEAPGYPDVYRLRVDNRSLYFPVDSVETVTVTASAPTMDTDYSLAGSNRAEVFGKVNEMIRKAGSNAASDSLLKRDLANMVLVDPSSIVAYYIINKQVGGTPIFSPDNKADNRVIGAVANAYSQSRPNDPRTDYLKALYLSNRRQSLTSVVGDSVQVNVISFVDIALLDETGKEQKLSDVAKQNKTVVLNFTAYSAEMSPALNVELAKSYDAMHERGLEIYQIGLDGDEFQWKQSARNLPWITVYNSPKDGMQHLMNYNVGALPAIFVIHNGELAARVDDPTKLQSTLSQYL